MRRLYEPNERLDLREIDLDLIKAHEGFRPTWYLCPAGVWTIGYGMTENVVPGFNRSTIQRLDKEESEAHLAYALKTVFEPIVERAVRVPLSPGEFGALVSFVFNLGEGNFRRSMLLRRLNEGDRERAAEEFDKWVWATVDGRRVQLPGLIKRRTAERAMFEQLPDEAVRAAIERVEPMELHTWVAPMTFKPDTLN